MTLNVDKSKIITFGKGRMKTRNQEWKWKRQELEIVKEFNYLGIRLQRNGNMIRHIYTVLNRIWEIGERKFKQDFKMRMYVWDILIAGILLYEVEL